MQNLLKLQLKIFSILIFLFGCSSSDLSEKGEESSEEDYNLSAAEMDYIDISTPRTGSKSAYSKNILIPLERTDSCDYVVKGKIEYVRDGSLLAKVDFGDGECDNIATKTVDGVDKEIKLNNKGKKHKKGKNHKKGKKRKK